MDERNHVSVGAIFYSSPHSSEDQNGQAHELLTWSEVRNHSCYADSAKAGTIAKFKICGYGLNCTIKRANIHIRRL